MSYLQPGDQMSMSNVTAADALLPLDVPLDNLEHHSNFDAETYAGSETATQYGHHSVHHGVPSLKRNASAYEDHFSDHMSNYDTPIPQEQSTLEPPSSIQRDNKLLSFSNPSFGYTLLDYASRPVSISTNAQLHGMFFLAESPWAISGEIVAPPTELTCYRRNLFQISGTLTVPRGMRYILTDQGEQIPILGQELVVSATESVEGNPVKIISVPWKTPASSGPPVEDRAEKEPSTMPLDLMSGQETGSEYVIFPISWKRLQFRIATANNGRRKELQQHFVLSLKVMATLSTGVVVPLCEAQSGAIIVRGRSPRNFQSRKDFPISSATARKSVNLPSRTSTGESLPKHAKHGTRASTSAIDIPHLSFPHNSNGIHVSPDFFDWKIPTGQPGAMTALPMDPPAFHVQSPPNAYAQSSPDLSRYPNDQKPQTAAPILLSLTDDEPRKSSSPMDSSRKHARISELTPRTPSFSVNLTNSPDESADLLYEYFPLSLDDWSTPCDAVYRPHVVHHSGLPTDPKALAVKNRSKRYFSDDQH
ncbi:hypothetical protein FKW77_003638 [Venturia effusa]|uniref:NDT80 domain-containing protein n=1 Tax=Venturia effusa TaxID=50376 RepID=A0A517LIF4_9PEZI|nr:hypothetical protein FKW77_003638 [Venturia effusa]